MALAPIALFVYNRPDHARATLAALAANPLAAESDLVVFSDGPKDARSEALVKQVRAQVRAAAGFRSVTVLERATNAGLVTAITEGVGRMCAEHGRVIVLEDDLVIAPQFLAFMNEALERYAEDHRVMQVSGYMYPVISQDRACFLPTVSCWGWATWKRAWDSFDPGMSDRKLIENNRDARRAFDLDGAYDYSKLLEQHAAGKVASWGVVWYLNVFAKNGLVLHPPQSLVSNVGFDGSGHHRSRERDYGLGRVDKLHVGSVFKFPDRVEVDMDVFELVKKAIRRSHRGWRNTLRRWF